MECVTAQDISVSFGSVTVLKGASLTAPAGKLTAVLGPSGCGKTTLLRVIAGLHRQHTGRVQLSDQDVTKLSAQFRRVSWVPQEGALFPHLTVAENIAFGLRGNTKNEVAQMLDLLQITELASRLPSEISGGQAQRVALARALVVQPRAVLLDEPFSALDASLRMTVRQDVRAALATAGVTAIMVTHDQQEALSLADWVVALNAGIVQQSGTPRHLYQAPATEQVARFVGDATILSARISGRSASTALGDCELADTCSRNDSNGFVVIRPEQIHLTENAAARRAQVLCVTFYGHDQDLELRDTQTGMTLTARVQGDRADITAGDQVRYRIAGPVAVVADTQAGTQAGT